MERRILIQCKPSFEIPTWVWPYSWHKASIIRHERKPCPSDQPVYTLFYLSCVFLIWAAQTVSAFYASLQELVRAFNVLKLLLSLRSTLFIPIMFVRMPHQSTLMELLLQSFAREADNRLQAQVLEVRLCGGVCRFKTARSFSVGPTTFSSSYMLFLPASRQIRILTECRKDNSSFHVTRRSGCTMW